MDNCIFCGFPINNFEAVCNTCGFIPHNKDFDVNKLQLFYKNLIKTEWVKGLKFIYEVHNYLNKNRKKWSTWETARFLGENKSSLIHQQINLAKELPNYPDLENSKSSNNAIKRLNEIKSGSITSDIQLEGELQDLIVKQWNNLFNEWELVDLKNQGKCNTNEIGEIDFMAQHKNEKGRYLVIELKIDQSSDETVG